MWKLPKPIDKVEKVFGDCISNTKDMNYKKKLEGCTDEIACATTEFEEKARESKTYTIKPKANVNKSITTEEMCKIYTDKMAKKSAPGRKYYDKYMAAPKNGICPLCGQRTVSTLDHYLPKKKFPTLVVSPVNLIPACMDCNKIKGETVFNSSEEETIHPYFDDIDSETWLYAKVIEEEPIAFSFYVQKPDSWDNILFKRMKNHFKLYKLNMLYSAHASQEFIQISRMLINLFEKAGVDRVKELLLENLESCEYVHFNSWKTAMYRALCNNEWFFYVWLKNQNKGSKLNIVNKESED